jgi:hypothetical protein
MTMSAALSAEVQSPARVPLVLWVGIGVYALLCSPETAERLTALRHGSLFTGK